MVFARIKLSLTDWNFMQRNYSVKYPHPVFVEIGLPLESRWSGLEIRRMFKMLAPTGKVDFMEKIIIKTITVDEFIVDSSSIGNIRIWVE